MVLQVGGNNVDNTDTIVQAILIASEMEELMLKLINEFCVKLVILVKFLQGNHLRKLHQAVMLKYLETTVQHKP